MGRVCFVSVLVFGLLAGSGRCGSAAGEVGLTPLYAIQNGDSNGDWEMDLSDAIYLLSYLYTGGPAPVPTACGIEAAVIQNGDSNGDGAVDLSHAVYLLGYFYAGGPAPAACDGRLGAGGGDDHRARIIPPDARPFGRTYGQWTAKWWQWAISLPAVPGHPFFDDASFDITTGQSGRVWFLAAPFGTVERTATIPKGTTLLLAVLNVEASSLEAPPFFGATEAEQLAAARAFADHIVSPFCSVDGKRVKPIGDFRVSSPQFTFTAPDPNILGVPGGTGTAVSDGYWGMIAPMPKGDHTIPFGGAFQFSVAEGDDFDLDASLDMT